MVHVNKCANLVVNHLLCKLHITSIYTRDSIFHIPSINPKSKLQFQQKTLFECERFDPTLRLKYDLYVIYSRDKRQPNVCQNIALNKGLDWCSYICPKASFYQIKPNHFMTFGQKVIIMTKNKQKPT